MRKVATGSVWIIAFALGVSTASAQSATERFIPIGQSPGLSDRYSWIGQIESVDRDTRSLVVASATGQRTARIGESTRIWLDRSALKLTNLSGEIEDCRPGQKVEIHYEDPARADFAKWIKLQVPASEVPAPRK